MQQTATADADTLPSGPPLRHSLAVTLRDLRQSRSLRLQDVAARLGISPSTLSRIETGKAPTRISYITLMLDIYGIDDPDHRAYLTQLAAQSCRQPWWHDYDDLLPSGTGHYLDLETAAVAILTYTTRLIPDLIQTPGYAAAAIAATRPGLHPDHLTRLAALHTLRQQRHACTNTTLHAVIDPAAITTPIAPPHVMKTQLAHLIAAAAAPSVTIQLTKPTTALVSPPFTLLHFADNPATGIICCPAHAGHLTIVRKHNTLTATRALFATLTRTALTPAATIALLAELAAP